MRGKTNKLLVIGLSVILVLTAFTLVVTPSVYSASEDVSNPGDDINLPVGGQIFNNSTENASANGAATFLRVEDYQPWAALVINAGDPSGVDLVTVSFDNDTLTITAQDSNETNHATILVNKEFADKYIADSEGNLEINVSDAVNYEGLDESNETADGSSYVFHIEHFSTQTIELSQQEDVPPVDKDEMHTNRAENASADGAVTFLRVEDYEPWAALVVNAGDPHGVDAVTVSFDDETLTIEAQDSNETNHVTILVNKGFADKYIADSEGDLEINVSDAVNYEGLDESNETAEGASYVFHIEHFSTQTIELTQNPSDFEPPVEGGQAFTDKAENAAANGAATFLRVEGYEPWAALVVNAGNPDGVDAVTVSFEDDTLTIEAQDSNETNHVTILVNKGFADKYIADSEGNLDFNLSEAVNYEGLDESNETAGSSSYVFHIEHFSTQTIEISKQSDFEPPVEGGQGFTDKAENAAANGAVTFLRVEGYEPWAAMVVNAGNPDGVDSVTVNFDDETLTIEAQDSNETNHVTILVNKEFADEHLADSEGDLDIETSDAVNYDGLDESNESAGGGGMYVFHIEHFSTQTIEISAADEIPFVGAPLILIAAAIPVVYYNIKKRKK